MLPLVGSAGGLSTVPVWTQSSVRQCNDPASLVINTDAEPSQWAPRRVSAANVGDTVAGVGVAKGATRFLSAVVGAASAPASSVRVVLSASSRGFDRIQSDQETPPG